MIKVENYLEWELLPGAVFAECEFMAYLHLLSQRESPGLPFGQ